MSSMVKRLSPRPLPSIDAKADASAGADSFGSNNDIELCIKDGPTKRNDSVEGADSNAAVTENVRAFIRALARQTARELAAEYFARRNQK